MSDLSVSQRAAAARLPTSPLNASRAFQTWPAFDPGRMLDYNPTLVRVGQEDWVLMRRDQMPLEHGQGSIWAVRVDAELMPVGVPRMLLEHGEDPRAIVHGGLVLVFYVVVERDEAGRLCGTSMAVAEFTVHSGHWQRVGNHLLPKGPLAAPGRPHPAWEKNWVPFVLDDRHVGLIYSHLPWDVLILEYHPASRTRRLVAHHRSPGLDFAIGFPHGGTIPVPYGPGQLLTFFHASEWIGGQRQYAAGACVFEAFPPFRPLRYTPKAVLLAPFKLGARRFGSQQAASVIFPLGAQRGSGATRLLCGIDDGEIGRFDVLDTELEAALVDVSHAPTRMRVHDMRGSMMDARQGPLLQVPFPILDVAELGVIRWVQLIFGTGRRMLDIGAHVGFYSIPLAPGYSSVEAFEPAPFQHEWLRRNVTSNGLDHVRLHACGVGAQAGSATMHIFSSDGGTNTLAVDVAARHSTLDQFVCPVVAIDDFGFDDVDFVKIDVEGFEQEVLAGARQTLMRCRPAILLEVWPEPERREVIQRWLDEHGYTFEFVFPLAPELAVCVPRERRAALQWFF